MTTRPTDENEPAQPQGALDDIVEADPAEAVDLAEGLASQLERELEATQDEPETAEGAP